MILGLLTAGLMLLTTLKFATRRMPWRRLDAFTMRIHPYAAVLAALLCVVHIAVTFGVFRQRPTAMWVVGVVMTAGLLVAVLSGIWKRRMTRRWLVLHRAAVAVACIALVIHIALGVISFGAYQRAIAALSRPDIAVSEVADGAYEGECDVGYIYARVRVTVDNGKIVDVDLLEHHNERGGEAESIPQTVVEAQSLDVDAVSGATNSSKVIKAAIANALEKGTE